MAFEEDNAAHLSLSTAITQTELLLLLQERHKTMTASEEGRLYFIFFIAAATAVLSLVLFFLLSPHTAMLCLTKLCSSCQPVPEGNAVPCIV